MCPGCLKRPPLKVSGDLSAEIGTALKHRCGIDFKDHPIFFACSYCGCVTDRGKRWILGFMKGTHFEPSPLLGKRAPG
jgi:hypothetical protein